MSQQSRTSLSERKGSPVALHPIYEPLGRRCGMGSVTTTFRVAAFCVALSIPATGLRGQAPSTPARSDAFRFERAIVSGGPGPNRLALDAVVLSHSSPFRLGISLRDAGEGKTEYVAQGGLADFRIFDPSGREVPYLLVAPSVSEPRWVQGRMLPIARTKTASGFEIDLGKPEIIDRLKLEGLPAPFLKRARLEGSGDRARWTMLVEEGTLFDLPAERLKLITLEFRSGEYRYLRITWDDRSSGRLPLPAQASARITERGQVPPALRVSLPFERRESEPGVSRFRLRLPGARLPIVALEIDCAGGDILREARIEEARFIGSEVVPVRLGSSTLRRALRGDIAAGDLRIAVESPAEAQLELVVVDRDNPPLELKGAAAVFAHLPWIYFESPGDTTLTARFGHDSLKPPRYDLEARRESVAKAEVAEARWGELSAAPGAGMAPREGPLPAMGAGIDSAAFRYSRALPPSPRGLTAAPLDAAVLAHSRMQDIRIAGADGHQVPYLLEKLGEPLSLELPPLEHTAPPDTGRPGTGASSRTNSYYRIRLPYAGLPEARLVLKTSARVFQRRVGILIEKDPYDARSAPWTRLVASAPWQHVEPDTDAPPLTLTIPGLESKEALIVVEEGDNNPLPLDRPRLLLPSYRIRFFREGDGTLSLLYGNPEVAAPRYDLALLAARLVAAPANEITPGPEGAPPPDTAVVTPNKIFWAVLIAAVGILLVLIVRLLRKQPAPPE